MLLNKCLREHIILDKTYISKYYDSNFERVVHIKQTQRRQTFQKPLIRFWKLYDTEQNGISEGEIYSRKMFRFSEISNFK